MVTVFSVTDIVRAIKAKDKLGGVCKYVLACMGKMRNSNRFLAETSGKQAVVSTGMNFWVP
jgi:hypothetical protein